MTDLTTADYEHEPMSEDWLENLHRMNLSRRAEGLLMHNMPIVEIERLINQARQVDTIKQQLQEYLDNELEVAKKDEHDWSSAGTIARIRKAILDKLELTYD